MLIYILRINNNKLNYSLVSQVESREKKSTEKKPRNKYEHCNIMYTS